MKITLCILPVNIIIKYYAFFKQSRRVAEKLKSFPDALSSNLRNTNVELKYKQEFNTNNTQISYTPGSVVG
jgi:hypothetical protein